MKKFTTLPVGLGANNFQMDGLQITVEKTYQIRILITVNTPFITGYGKII